VVVNEPGIGYRFVLEIDGYDFGSFSKVDGINATYDVTKVKEGGENGYVHALPGRVSYGNVTLTRALDTASARLAAWFTEYQSLLGSGGRHKPTSASIAAVSAAQQVVTTWNFADVVPVKYTGPSFDAGGAAVAVEKMEFAHHGFWSGSSSQSAAFG
jgi:phage tail-like protein